MSILYPKSNLKNFFPSQWDLSCNMSKCVFMARYPTQKHIGETRDKCDTYVINIIADVAFIVKLYQTEIYTKILGNIYVHQ